MDVGGEGEQDFPIILGNPANKDMMSAMANWFSEFELPAQIVIWDLKERLGSSRDKPLRRLFLWLSLLLARDEQCSLTGPGPAFEPCNDRLSLVLPEKSEISVAIPPLEALELKYAANATISAITEKLQEHFAKGRVKNLKTELKLTVYCNRVCKLCAVSSSRLI